MVIFPHLTHWSPWARRLADLEGFCRGVCAPSSFLPGSHNPVFCRTAASSILTRCSFLCADVIWVILSVEVGGLLGVTQQLSSFQAEFNTQPHRRLEGDYNPFASPEKSKCPNGNNNSLHDASVHRVAEEHWQGSPDQLQQDQNGLSQNSVDLVANSLQSNLSVVSYNQVRHVKGQGDVTNQWVVVEVIVFHHHWKDNWKVWKLFISNKKKKIYKCKVDGNDISQMCCRYI